MGGNSGALPIILVVLAIAMGWLLATRPSASPTPPADPNGPTIVRSSAGEQQARAEYEPVAAADASKPELRKSNKENARSALWWEADGLASTLLLVVGTFLFPFVKLGSWSLANLFGYDGSGCDSNAAFNQLVGYPVILTGAGAAVVGVLVFKRLGRTNSQAILSTVTAVAPTLVAAYMFGYFACAIG